MRKYWMYGIITFQVILIVSLLRGASETINSRVRLRALEEKRDKLIVEGNNLKDRLVFVSSPYYLEKIAREQLHLSKPGEIIVIMPERNIQPTAYSAQNIEDMPNWQKWVSVLLGKD